jgi:hypothetical protein
MNRVRSWVVLILVVALVACGTAQPPPPSVRYSDEEITRYRLLLRHNSVSPSDAFRCYNRCQPQTTPNGYLECLAECPGFEITPGETCAKYEVPPVAACLTVRKIPKTREVPPGVVVLAVVGSFLLVVGASSLCAASSSQCGAVPPP